MKGFLIIVCIFCTVITFAYTLKKINAIKNKTKVVKRKSQQVDLPFKNIEVKLKRKP